MRVLILSSTYAPRIGGLENVTHNLAKQLIEEGHDVRVITNRYPRSLSEEEVIENVPVKRLLFLSPQFAFLQRGRFDLLGASLYFYPRTLFYLKKFIKKFMPEVINLHFPDSQIPFVLKLRRQFKFRLVVSLHGDEVERFFDPNRKRDKHGLNNLCEILSQADVVTTCSNYLLSRAIALESSIKQKGRVIYNGINLERFKDNGSYGHPKPYLLAYGRFVYKKGFDILIDAFSKIEKEHSGVDLILAGDGEERENFKNQVHELGLNNRIRFYGSATQKEIVALSNGCEFVVIPSRQEPFGIVALEAMAAGKAVLTTRVGGLPEFIEPSINRLVEPTVEDLAKGLDEWLGRSSEVRENGKKNAQQVLKYSIIHMADQYFEIYR